MHDGIIPWGYKQHYSQVALQVNLYPFPGFIISIYSFTSEQMKEFTCQKHYRWQEYDENACSLFAKGAQSRTYIVFLSSSP